MDDTKLKAELARDEDRRLTAYRDSNGYWTIGVGHLLGASPRMSSITDDECDALLEGDIKIAERGLVLVFGQMNGGAGCGPVRYRAMVNMMFNRGLERVRQSSTITPAIKVALATGSEESWKKVADAIRVSPWAKQIKARAERLAVMLETGQ